MTTKFTNLGSKIIQVTLSPSTVLYTRKSSLLATLGSKDLVVVAAPSLKTPGIYQKITSTAPLTALISTQSSSGDLSVLTLDGSIDWVIARSKFLHSFWGDSLAISSRAKWLSIGRPLLVSGRGLAALQSTSGPIHTLSLTKDQSIVINRKSLLAYSVDSNLGNPVSALSDNVQYNSSLESLPAPPSSAFSPLTYLRSFYDWCRSDGSHYQLVKGPTTLYVTSPTSFASSLPSLWPGSPNQSPLEINANAQAAKIVARIDNSHLMATNTGLTGTPEQHLKVATVENGKVVFNSTKSFDNL